MSELRRIGRQNYRFKKDGDVKTSMEMWKNHDATPFTLMTSVPVPVKKNEVKYIYIFSYQQTGYASCKLVIADI